MNLQRLAQGDLHEVVASGRIDGEGATQLEGALGEAMAEGAKRIHVDLSGATFISSPGLRALLQAWRNMQSKGGILHVVDPSVEASTLLNTSGFQKMVLQKA